ncbi:hypothetical protein EDC52_102232 [Biostraticola tofi]|uniref:Uncharacterized protein n=1 Tax=Biostraticola tofi TaxID=466109 RepID=A0A4R3Z4K5_9GAMM|nr:hypothetical protein EDC52_102232 [Biostraticola tofi]
MPKGGISESLAAPFGRVGRLTLQLSLSPGGKGITRHII